MPPIVTLLIILVLLGLLLAGATVLIVAHGILTPPRMTDGRAIWRYRRLSPGDLGLRFENETFTLRDASRRDGRPLHIAGWWIPSDNAAAGCYAVLLHGYGDAKVGVIAYAPLLHQLGWNVLAIDLRAHGESGGRYSTAGFWERDDVSQVINQLQASRPTQATTLVIVGTELGAAVAAATAAMRDDIAGVVLEHSFDDFSETVIARAATIGLGRGPFIGMALRVAEWLAGARFADVRPADMIRQIRCPSLVSHDLTSENIAEFLQSVPHAYAASLPSPPPPPE
jgi:pimeloyl-ACP methyl ester carboxylesterase